MADSRTVARPYAKTIFEMARDKGVLQNWNAALKLLALITQDKNVIDFVNNPITTVEQRTELFLFVVEKSKIKIDRDLIFNFIMVLAENHRLLVLDDIYSQYAEIYAQYSKTMEVVVTSYAPLTKSQEENLIARLSARLQREVILNIKIDKSLKGGAIIQAGHLVFDASVDSQIRKLGSLLAA